MEEQYGITGNLMREGASDTTKNDKELNSSSQKVSLKFMVHSEP